VQNLFVPIGVLAVLALAPLTTPAFSQSAAKERGKSGNATVVLQTVPILWRRL
jgi:hypothetical protein